MTPRSLSDPPAIIATQHECAQVSRGTGGRWSDRAKAAYKSWQDYIIAVKGNMRLRVTLSTQSESANLVDFVEWRFVVWLGP